MICKIFSLLDSMKLKIGDFSPLPIPDNSANHSQFSMVKYFQIWQWKQTLNRYSEVCEQSSSYFMLKIKTKMQTWFTKKEC